MKKYILFFILCLFVLPLNAQRVIKYVSFYPVPYGSHDTDVYVLDPEEYSSRGMLSDNIDVNNIQGESNKTQSTAVLNASRGSNTTISGDFILPENQSDGKASFKAKSLKISQKDFSTNTYGNTKPNIVAGASPIGPALVIGTGNTFVSNGTAEILGSTGLLLSSTIFKAESTEVTANASATDKFGQSFKNIADGCNCDGISNCGYVRGWKQIRIKGSEKCKQFLVCSYNTSKPDNSCQDPASVCHGSCDRKCYTSAGQCKGFPQYIFPITLNGKSIVFSINSSNYSCSNDTYRWTFNCRDYANGNSNELSETFGTITATLSCTDYKGWGNLTISWNCSCGSEQHPDYEWSESQKRCVEKTYTWHCDPADHSYWEVDCQNNIVPYAGAPCDPNRDKSSGKWAEWDGYECQYAWCSCEPD